jgi:hypothetical protein
MNAMSMPSFDDTYFETLDRPVKLRICDCPGCGDPGDYRAPKTRALTDYYFFCLGHVREYNAAWDYFAGMTGADIEAHIRGAAVWERPSWPLGEWRVREQKLREEVMREFFSDASVNGEPFPAAPPMPAAERDALATLELAPPVTFAAIKSQYRVLVKRHHPDLHGGSAESGEKFKGINQAFAVLRAIYEGEIEVRG